MPVPGMGPGPGNGHGRRFSREAVPTVSRRPPAGEPSLRMRAAGRWYADQAAVVADVAAKSRDRLVAAHSARRAAIRSTGTRSQEGNQAMARSVSRRTGRRTALTTGLGAAGGALAAAAA